MGCGYGTVDSAVASNTIGPGFESSHQQLYLKLTVCRKDEKWQIKRFIIPDKKVKFRLNI